MGKGDGSSLRHFSKVNKNLTRAVSTIAPCGKTACKQVLYVDCFLWRFFRKGVSAKKIIELGIQDGKIFRFLIINREQRSCLTVR
jgi:enoyl reductase-like protein